MNIIVDDNYREGDKLNVTNLIRASKDDSAAEGNYAIYNDADGSTHLDYRVNDNMWTSVTKYTGDSFTANINTMDIVGQAQVSDTKYALIVYNGSEGGLGSYQYILKEGSFLGVSGEVNFDATTKNTDSYLNNSGASYTFDINDAGYINDQDDIESYVYSISENDYLNQEYMERALKGTYCNSDWWDETQGYFGDDNNSGSYGTYKDTTLSSLKSSFENLFNSSNKNILEPYMNFKIGNFKINTAMLFADNLESTDYNNETVLSSFQYTRGTEGEANQFTIVIAYNVSNNSLLNGAGLNPIELETELINGATFSNSETVRNTFNLGVDNAVAQKEIADLELKSAYLQFGYTTEDNNLIKSPKYRMYITNYTCEYTNQYMIYNITGTSTNALSNTIKFKRKGYKKDKYPTQAALTSLKANLLDNGLIITGKMPDGTNIVRSDKTFEDATAYVQVTSSSKSGDTTNVSYNYVDGTGLDKSEDEKTLLENVNEILNYAIWKEDSIGYNTLNAEDSAYKLNSTSTNIELINNNVDKEDSNNKNAKITNTQLSGNYEIICVDNPKKYVRKYKYHHSSTSSYPLGVYALVYKKVAQTESDTLDMSTLTDNIVYEFSVGDKEYQSPMVIDFRTELQGSVLRAINIEKIDSELKTRIDASGEEISGISTIGDSADITSENLNTINELYRYVQLANQAYKATLITIGIPFEIPLLSYIKINSIFNGVSYIHSGIYYVIGVEDTFSEGTYTTTLKLMKAVTDTSPANFLDKYYELKNIFNLQYTQGNTLMESTLAKTKKIQNYANKIITGGYGTLD